jgi:nucleotide-binding universal stress UspA family protein
MALKDILVCLDSTETGDVRCRLAMRLAREHRAQLIGAYALADDDGPAFEPRSSFGGGASDGAGIMERSLASSVTPGAARAEEAEQRFYDELRLNGLSGTWRLIEQGDETEMVALAKTVDLSVLGQYSRESHSAAAFRPDEIALACGRPLLIVPYVGDFATVGEHVLVAWDDTRESIRALNDALPLIERAKMVTVMIVVAHEKQAEQAHAPLQRIVAHLDRHGVPVRSEQAMRGELTVSDLLLSRAADLGADMIVAGAFHHSPLREALLGGVSRDLLRHMTVPVLMSH